MQVTIEVPDTIAVSIGKRTVYGQLTVEPAKFSAAMNWRIYEYGLRQKLNDAAATKEDKDGNKLAADVVVAKSQAVLDKIYADAWDERGVGEPTDPVEALAHKLVKLKIVGGKTYKAANVDVPKGTKDRFMFVINRLRAAKGQPETTEAEFIAEVLAGPQGAAIREEAARALKEGEDLL